MAGTLPAPDFHADPRDRSALRPRRRGRVAAVASLLVLGGAAAWFWWPVEEPDLRPAAVTVTPPAPADEEPPPAAPVVRYPLPPADGVIADAGGMAAALQQLLGSAAAFVITDDFARRTVATIDQLGREHAPPSSWPVTPTAGRFLVEQRGDTVVIAEDNAPRYAPLVGALTAVDAGAIAALYRRLYPLLDGAWHQLGMGDRYLNDRVVEVIDLLLRTPEPAQPIAVQLTEVKGPVPSTRPWLRYEFADPALEALPAGQKILLRLGPAEREKAREQLRALRRHLVHGG